MSKFVAQGPHTAGHNVYSLQEAARVLQERLKSESAPKPVVPRPSTTFTKLAGLSGNTFKYRSKASITYTNLPALVINQ
jgi:hypothetical protein